MYNNSFLNSISQNNILLQLNENKNLNSFFLKFLFDSLYSLEEKNLISQFNQNLYFFLLNNNIFVKYFKNLFDLLNYELISINFYNIVKKESKQNHNNNKMIYY